MRTTSKRAMMIYALIAAFTAGVIILAGMFIKNGETWALNRANKHLFSGGNLTNAGTIYDRNGVSLAESKNGERIFNKNSTVRRATLHAVGDTAGVISSGAHNIYRSELTGYSLLNGTYSLSKYGKGNNITLTLDSKVCAAASQALGNRKGTVGVYNYKTGEVICMVSHPTFDPNNKPGDIETDTTGKYDGIYLNRFLSGVFTPGSTFKVVTATCAVENIPDIQSRTFECKGKLQTKNGVVICNDTHGKLTFEQALNKSCNSVFAQVAIELGAEKLTATANRLGFNTPIYLDGIKAANSKFNISAANDLDLGWAGIGQYTTLANPMQMMVLMGAIANNGTPVQPYLLSEVKSPSGVTLRKGSTKTLNEFMSEPVAQTMNKLMRSNVANYYGDSRFPANMKICAKTGTAQVADDDGKEPHAWFVGYSQNPKTPYAFVVMIENGGAGNKQALPVAIKVLNALK